MKIIKAAFLYISLVFIAIFITLLFLEIVLRVVSPYPFFTKIYPANLLGHNLFRTSVGSVFDPILGWYPMPGHHPAHPNFGYEQKTHFNGGIRSNQLHTNGFDSSIAPPLFLPARSILVVGDSFTEGVEVGNDKTWPAFLEQLSGYRVLNGGVGGYGLDQSYLRAVMLLKKYKVKHLIISFNPDNLERTELSARSGAFKPYFTCSNGELVLQSNHVKPPQYMDPNVVEKLRNNYNVLAHSFLAIKIMELLSNRADWLIQFGGSKKEHKNGGIIGCGLMKKAKELEKIYSVNVWILIQYQDYYIYDKVDGIPKKWIADYYSKTLETKKYALAQNLNVIDLFDPLKELYIKNPVEFKKLYIDKHRHMSQFGNHFVAKYVRDVMFTNGP